MAWADWDEELLSLELQELNAEDFDLSLTGFNSKEIDDLLALPEEEEANTAPPLPDNRLRVPATCGSVASIACYAGVPLAPKMWGDFWVSASRS